MSAVGCSTSPFVALAPTVAWKVTVIGLAATGMVFGMPSVKLPLSAAMTGVSVPTWLGSLTEIEPATIVRSLPRSTLSALLIEAAVAAASASMVSV